MFSSRTRDTLPQAAVALAIVATVIVLLSRIAHAAQAVVPPPPGIDWTFWIAVGSAILGGLSVVLHVVAPRTKNTIDDEIRDDVDKLLAFMRTQNVVPPRNTQAGSTTLPNMIAVALIGLVIGGAIFIGCTSAQRGAAATSAGHALINCTAQPLGTTPGLDLGTLAAVVNLAAAERLKCTTPAGLDWKCVETDAIGQGVTLGGCALVQLVAAAAKAITPAASGLAAIAAPPPGRVELEAFRLRFAGATWHTATDDY